MKPIDDDGRELDAIFTVEPTASGIYLILESRGGGEGGPRPPRNADYAEGLELLLRRLGQQGAILTDVEVYSRVTSNWPSEKRRITAPDFPLPINLIELTDIQKFRHQLGGASAALGRDGTTGGNPTKRLRLMLEWPNAIGKASNELEDILAGGVQRPAIPAESDNLRYAPLGKFISGKTEAEFRLKLSEITVNGGAKSGQWPTFTPPIGLILLRR